MTCTEVSLPAVISSSSAVALRLQMWRIFSAAGEWSLGAGHGATSRLRLYASRAASRLARALAARAERSAAAGLGERRERRQSAPAAIATAAAELFSKAAPKRSIGRGNHLWCSLWWGAAAQSAPVAPEPKFY